MGKVKGDKQMRKISSIAAHVPDLVVYSDFRKIPYVEHFNGVLLFADVSGLASLTLLTRQLMIEMFCQLMLAGSPC